MDNQDDLKTQPTATAIMERLQSMEARLLSEMERLNLLLKEELTTKFGHQLLSLKEELTAQFARLSTKIEVLNDDILTVRAGQRDILKRLNES